MKTIFAILSAGLILSCANVCRGALVTFSFTGAAGDETSFAPDAQPANATVSDMTRGSGVTPGKNAGTFSGSAWTTTASRDLTDYYSFTITPAVSYQMTLTRLELDERRSLTGIRDWAIYSSLDSFGTALVTFNVPDDDNTRVNEGVDLGAAFSSLSSAVEFRIYGFSAEASSGTWRIDNVELSGSLTAVPEPVTWALIVFGTVFGAVQLGRLYRRHLAAC